MRDLNLNELEQVYGAGGGCGRNNSPAPPSCDHHDDHRNNCKPSKPKVEKCKPAKPEKKRNEECCYCC